MCLVFQNVPTLVDVIVDIIDKNEQQGQGKSWSIVGRKQSQHRPWCPLTGHVDIRPDRHSSLQRQGQQSPQFPNRFHLFYSAN